MLVRDIELLAPARDLACGIAAIEHGADAVYIGGPLFGARAAAGNSLEDIAQLVRHAHLFRARVYVALNTLFTDEELPQAVRLCHQLDEIGVDALIIQDLGLLECDLPPIPLHASTQLNNRTPEKVRFLEQVGFTQVVLARELSLKQIQEIRSATSVPLECFVHGALCVSYSGQCYISEIMAGRSANRGQCAQFCRHAFSLEDTQGKVLIQDRYLLSLKDLDLSAHLADLIDAGVRSFKIEGRLKDSHYVKNVTAFYRQTLDRIIDQRPDLIRASSGRCQLSFQPDPARSFSRGATEYFLRVPKAGMAETRTPKSIGKRVGRVLSLAGNSFFVEGNEPLHNGDGLCFFTPSGTLIGLRVNRVQGKQIFPKDPLHRVGLYTGCELYRNNDVAFSHELEQSHGCRSLAIEMKLSQSTTGLVLSIKDEDAFCSETPCNIEVEKAKTPGAIERIAAKQLQKTGGTIFSVSAIELELDPELFIPAAALNELRRQALTQHQELRLHAYNRERRPLQKSTVPWIAEKLDYQDNISNRQTAAFFQRHGLSSVDARALSPQQAKHPDLMTTKYCIRRQLGICAKKEGKNSGNGEPLLLKDKTGCYLVEFHCERCEMTISLKN
nr:U32 family peptidase [uncultured Desulfobulbus sp.]